VKGVVTDGKSPVAGAAVRLRKVSPKSADGGAHEMESMMTGMLGLPKGGTVIYTGREGEFHYERLVPGSYQIEAELAGHTESPSQPFTLGPGETREVSLVVDPGGEISGEVVDPRGKPIPQARVRLLKLPKEGKEVKEGFDSQGALEFQKMMGGSYRSATTGEDGAFQITGLRQDRFLVLASAPGYTGGELSGVSPGPKRQKIVLTPAATLRGLVTDLANGRPITRFRLALDREEGEGSPMNPLADFTAEHQDGDGRFNQEDLAPGKYEVSVAASGYAPLRKKVVLAAGGSLEESFPLAQAGRIRGTVVEEETGLPLSGARITVEGSGPEERSRKRPRKQGKVRIQVTAAAEPPAEGPAPEEEEAMAHHFTHEFLDEEGTSSGEDGSFLLESVPEGTQVILASHPDYVPTVSEEIEVRSGQEVSLDFSLPRGLAISGKVVGSSGEPAPGTMLFLHRVGEEVPPLEKHAMSGEEGRFRFAGLEKGSYRLSPLQSFKASPEGASAQAKREPLVIELREDQTGIEVRLPPASE
jgi:5-hydroxyisourate hydrolase-like protein (transthyretin family)